MRILFGPAHDNRHIDPDTPGGYEWWYFDALSDDGRYALVVIYFIGTPMSPYYKRTVDGRGDRARDWCGVFVSLHEINPQARSWRDRRWHERAYAYNLYPGGDASPDRPDVRIGASTLTGGPQGAAGAWEWHLSVAERGLWRGETHADLTFSAPGTPADLPETGDGDAAHSWACVAPVCRVDGTVTTPEGETIAFHGAGYHDHNWGRLPWDDTDIWYWGRATFPKNAGTVVLYRLVGPYRREQQAFLVFDNQGQPVLADTDAQMPRSAPENVREVGNSYGLRHAAQVCLTAAGDGGAWLGKMELAPVGRALSEGPFYRRVVVPFHLLAPGGTVSGRGIAEVFRPARLCGPIASRAMWSRMRRRK